MMKRIIAGMFTVIGIALAGSAIAQETWFPSKWGADDELGAANYLSPDKVLAASKLVTTGKTYPLGITVNRLTPAFPPRRCDIYIVQPGQVGSADGLGPTSTTYNDDILNCWIGIGSQIDGLGHIGIGNTYYNGFKWADIAPITGLTKLGVHNIPPIVTRGVVLDIAGHLGVPMLTEGQAINQAEIEGAAAKQGVEIREGDVVLLHTGWMSILDSDPERFGKAEPGLGVGGAKYLVGKGVVAVGADTWGVEAVPFEQGEGIFGVHQELLTRSGTYILENMNTADLVADEAWEFLFVLGQPRYEGAVQAMVNPVAIR
ncbi:MAG: cyclase family protein [Burkholderiaceae bacterium]